MYSFPDEEQTENIGKDISELLYKIYTYIYELIQ